MRRLALACAVLAPLLHVGPVAAQIGTNNLGLNTHVPANDLLDMSADLGVTWIRVDANWNQLNPSMGTFNWTEMDRVVDQATTRGLRVYMTLAYTPDWVARFPRMRFDAFGGNDEPLTSTEWVAFVEAAVARYSARGVTHFGIWNEPNLDQFWESAAGVDPYVDKILVPGAAAVRRTCATCVVLGPDLAHVGDYDVFLDRVLTRALASFDILAHHIYNDWPENGRQIFDGDRFLEALEMRRFTFTRASLREVLDRRGWTGEVWITETGYRATPGDGADEGRQDTFVRRVMEEQLARAWWTNSFFYEVIDCGVDQPACPIDGFGITRPNRPVSMGGPRSFPSDYRLKPAYLTIRDFIDMNPEIVMGGAPPECGNGVDDDGDGRVDSRDRGCTDGTDPDESDDPPRRTLEVNQAPRGTMVDGSLADFGPGQTLTLGVDDWQGVTPYGGADDLSATITARYTADALWIGITVTDDVHVATDPDDQLYLGDSVQLAFDVGANRNGDAYDDDDHELNFAFRDGMTEASFRFHGDGTDDWQFEAVRSGTTTVYEIAIPRTALGDPTLREGTELGFSFLVNEDDGEATADMTGREGWVELTGGIGTTKDPYQYGTMTLVRNASPTDAGAPTDGGAGADGGSTDRDGGASGVDAGPTDGGDDGCGCRTVGARSSGAPLWLALVGLALIRRRR